MQTLSATPIPPADLKKVPDLFEQSAAVLRPYFTSLTPDERVKMLKMAEKTVVFVQKALEYACRNPSFMPAFVDLNEFTQDTDALTLDTDSTQMLAGSDAYAAALIPYNNKQPARCPGRLRRPATALPRPRRRPAPKPLKGA